LERVISRVHAVSIRVSDLVNVLEAFELIVKLTTDHLQKNQGNFQSKLLRRICTLGGLSEEITEILDEFSKSFDRDIAKSEGTIVVSAGIEKDYDQISETIKSTENELQAFLQKLRRKYSDNKISYRDIGKNPYQLEFSKDFDMPESWSVMSQTKYVNRYHTPEIKTWIKRLDHDKDTLAEIRKNLLSRMCSRFVASYGKWLAVISEIATLDALMSLCMTKINALGPACRPEFVESETGIFHMQDLRHPCVTPRIGNDFIPNDVNLGGEYPLNILLTGPNMGGKSTLLRQVCIATIMAQIGCYVPAESCRMTTVDRIFTRLGANDDILTGQSTFMVELQETSNIMKHATPRSLVILDELGRGTSTYDGFSIAFAVLDHLVQNVNCCTLFSTHYHKLTAEYENRPSVGLHHMACFVDDEQGDVTFLYKLAPGVCPKSYGMNVAKMAGIRAEIVDRAETIAKEFEEKSLYKMGKAQVLRLLTENLTPSTVKSVKRVWCDLPKQMPTKLV